MRYAEAEIEIAAPIEVVWDVMLDLPRYGEWNPFVHRIEAKDRPIRVGGELVLDVRWAGGGGARSRERVTRLEAPSDGRATLEYVFLGPLAAIGAVSATRVQALEQLGNGTRYRTREDFGGWLRAALPLAKVQAGFVVHARALKERAEKLAADAR